MRYPSLPPSPKLFVFVCETLRYSRSRPASTRACAYSVDELPHSKTTANVRPTLPMQKRLPSQVGLDARKPSSVGTTAYNSERSPPGANSANQIHCSPF